MATLGYGDLKDKAYPSYWDVAELKKIQLSDGATFDSVVGDVQAAMSALNGDFLSMPHYADMIAVQDTPELEYPVGVTNGVQEATEYGVPDPKRGKTTGHMLPLKKYDRALGWTMMYLREARRMQLDADVRSAITDMRNHWQKTLLTRFFKSTYDAVASSGRSVPFADAGTADANYVPPDSPDGESFASSHTHLLRVDTIANALPIALETLQEHGHTSPYDIIASRADAASWKAVTGWKAPEWPGVVYHATTTERAAISEISDYYGYIETSYGIARVWLTPRVPTNYFGLFKPYGPGDPRNPLRVRISQTWGFGWQLIPGLYVNAPATLAVMYNEFGVGIGEDRTNGVLTYINATGSYTDPTIS